MLYQIGPLTLDTRPFNADGVRRSADAAFAAKPVIATLSPREFMGEGEDRITVSGQLLPFKTGGLSELETAHSLRRQGVAMPVVRGDGRSFGWFVIERISETHRELMRDGVGFVVRYSLTLVKTKPGGTGIIGTILSLFAN